MKELESVNESNKALHDDYNRVNVENINLSEKLKQFIGQVDELDANLKEETKASSQKTDRIRLL